MSSPPSTCQECVEVYLYATAPVEFLLFRRPPDRGSIWVPVSGKVEPSDACFQAAALRELEEETGLARPSVVSDLHWAFDFAGPDGRPWRLHAFAVEVSRRWAPRLSREHNAFEWLPPAAALERLHYEDNREAARRLLQSVGAPPEGGPPTSV